MSATMTPSTADSVLAVLALCRAGFEPDLAAEFRARKSRVIEQAPGFVIATRTPTHDFIFARQCVAVSAKSVVLSGNDRVNPLTEAAIRHLAMAVIPAVADVRIEFPDTNDGKALSRLVKVLEPRIMAALGPRCQPNAPLAVRLHVFLAPDSRAWVGHSMPANTPWRNGIPRLRLPGGAPSRSTMKLAEAFETFLGEDIERAILPDMRAVDLGAAPGGWTWQFVHRGVRVTAIDNGPLKGDMADNAMVKHLRMDGFRYEPKHAVDWMVCDMVEKPSRVAQLVARWMGAQWCNASIFNLKLPMKKRLEEVDKCRSIIHAALAETGRRHQLAIRQLYHDREEVTGFCRFLPRRS
jgi:23S rRNA (cytidine2498-2'-O)-methyltransferase